jgi:hypothetical protein|tara:strand:+ start:262 stop:564 length:303 start_codon:yes stop_codon:yes gene_type:complete
MQLSARIVRKAFIKDKWAKHRVCHVFLERTTTRKGKNSAKTVAQTNTPNPQSKRHVLIVHQDGHPQKVVQNAKPVRLVSLETSLEKNVKAAPSPSIAPTQ